MNVTVTSKARDWEALLAALPRCSRCSSRAAVTLNGLLLCVPCIGKRRRGRLLSLPYADAAEAVEAALSPSEPEGTWSKDERSR